MSSSALREVAHFRQVGYKFGKWLDLIFLQLLLLLPLIPKVTKSYPCLFFPARISCQRYPAGLCRSYRRKRSCCTDLGLGEAVAGITKFCIHPDSWFRTKPRIGGTKTVHFDKVKALQPDLILANKEENVQEQVEALTILAPVWMSDIHNLEDSAAMITAIGELTGKRSGGRRHQP